MDFFSIRPALALLIIISTLYQLTPTTEGAKILSIAFFGTRSHKITYETLLYTLAERGHEVTIVNPVKSDKQLKNVRNVGTIDLEKFLEKEFPNLFEMKSGKPGLLSSIGGFIFSITLSPFLFFGGMADKVCRASYALPQVQEVMTEKYDLIIFSPFINDCLYGLIYKMNTSTILFTQTAVFPWIASVMGTPTPPSFVPLALHDFSDKMTFGQRVINLVSLTSNWVAQNLVYNPKMEALYREILNDPTIPSIKEIERNASLVLSNSHLTLTPPRPLLPDIVNVGGLHLKAPKALSKDLDDFLSGSGPDGFIYFSMGSALKGSTMPEKYRQIFLQTFANLKQRVLWKWETEQMDDLPKNVKLSKWLPQQDVLGHKNIRLFITHGGHGGTQESIYHGVPLVGIPITGDQTSNMGAAKRRGFAIPLEFSELTSDLLTDAINTIINDPSYHQRAKELSALFHDQIDKPLDRAVYWTEYVLRHQGATHLRSAARDLNFVQYHSIDVVLFVLAILLTVLYLNFVIFRALFRKCCGKTKSQRKNTSGKKTN